MAHELEIVTNPRFRNMHTFLVHVHSRTPHIHPELEIGYVLQGSATLHVGSQTIALSLEDGYLINPFETHAFHAAQGGAVMLAVQVSPQLFDSFLSEAPLLRFSNCSYLRDAIKYDTDYKELLHLCKKLAICYISKPPNYEYDCFSLVTEWIARLHRLLPEESLSRNAWQARQKRLGRFLAILDYIDENYRHKLLLKELAERENLTMSYLSHMFRNTLGMTFQEYLGKKRFEYARTLILDTRCSLLEISLESGFSDARYMIHMFQEEFGCSPREYRQCHQAGPAPPRNPAGSIQHFLGEEEALMLLRKNP